MKKTTLYHILLWIMILCLIGLIVWRFLSKEENTIANADVNKTISTKTEESTDTKNGDDFTTTVDVNNNINNISYLNIKGKRTAYTINLCFYYLENLPTNNDLTFEVFNNINNENVYTSFLIYAPDGDKIYRFNNGVQHITIDKETLKNGTAYAYVIQTSQSNSEQSYNFNLYAYYGDYVPGFGQGFQTGYENGLAEGSGIAKYGIWQNATVDGKFTYDVNNKDVVINGTNLKPDFEYGAIYFKTIAKQYEIYPNDPDIYLSSANISIYLNEPMSYNPSLRPIVNSGTSLINVTLIDANGKRYDLEVIKEQGYYILKFSNPDIQEVNNIVQIDFSVGRAADLLYEVYLISLDQSYYGGYSEGYNKGLDSGRAEGIVIGREQGYKNGYEEGKNASLSEQTGFSVITSMLSNVMSIFELKVFGWFGLGDIIGIALIFGIVLFALKLIRG